MNSIDDTLRKVLSLTRVTETELVSLSESFGRVLSANLVTRFDAPSFDNSAMDGYAVKALDVCEASSSQPKRLRVVDEVRAGHVVQRVLQSGEAMRIFTGGQIPAGADAIVVQEDTTALDDEGVRSVDVRFAAPLGHHIRRRGEDLRVGESLVRAGQTVHGGVVGLLASQGVAEVPVFRRPRIAILTTGDEVVSSAGTLAEGSVFDSNGPMLEALVGDAGGVAIRLRHAGDTLLALTEQIERANDYDLLVTVGGASVGDHDLVRAGLTASGVELALWKVAMKPGKPLGIGVREDRLFSISLPGNPVSAFVTFFLFVGPVVRAMQGSLEPHYRIERGVLAHDVSHGTGRTEFVRARAIDNEPVRLEVHPRQGSGSLASLAYLNAFAILPGERARFAEGDEVQFIRFSERAGEMPLFGA